MPAQRKVTATYGKRKKSTLDRQKGADHEVFRSGDDAYSKQLRKDTVNESLTTRPTLRSRVATPTKHTTEDRGKVTDVAEDSDDKSSTEYDIVHSSKLLYPFGGSKQERRPKPARYHTIRALPGAKILRDIEVEKRAAHRGTQQSSDSLEIIGPQQCSSDVELEIPNYNSSPLATSTPQKRSNESRNSVDKRKRKYGSDDAPIARHSSMKKPKQDDFYKHSARSPYGKTTSSKRGLDAKEIGNNEPDTFSDDNMILCDEDAQAQHEMQIDEQDTHENSDSSNHSDYVVEIGRRGEQAIQDDPGFQLETVLTFAEPQFHKDVVTEASKLMKNAEKEGGQSPRTKHHHSKQTQAHLSAVTTFDGILQRKNVRGREKENGLVKRNPVMNQSMDYINDHGDDIIQAISQNQLHAQAHGGYGIRQQQEGSFLPTIESTAKFTKKVRDELQNRFRRYVLKPIQNMPGNVRTGLSVRKANIRPEKEAYATAELDELQALMDD